LLLCIFLSTKGAYYGANYLAFYLLLILLRNTLSISCLLRISNEGEIEGWLRTRSKQEIDACLFR
jgi:hypothetical protein